MAKSGEQNDSSFHVDHGGEAMPRATYLPTVSVLCESPVSLRCEDCDETFIVYDTHAERGHGLSAGDLRSDVERHAQECGR